MELTLQVTTTPQEYLVNIISQYAEYIDQRGSFFTCLEGLAHAGQLSSGHEYVIALVASLAQPLKGCAKDWHSFAQLGGSGRQKAEQFAANFRNATGSAQLSFTRTAVRIDTGSDKLDIAIFAPEGVVTKRTATLLADPVVSDLCTCFSAPPAPPAPAKILSLSVLLLPPKIALFTPNSSKGGVVPADWHQKIADRRGH